MEICEKGNVERIDESVRRRLRQRAQVLIAFFKLALGCYWSKWMFYTWRG